MCLPLLCQTRSGESVKTDREESAGASTLRDRRNTMSNDTKRLVAHVTRLTAADLPHDIVHETKRALLDSLGCAVNGHSMEGGRIAVALANRLGGPAEASIIGTDNRVGCTNAAFANAQLCNCMDFDGGSIAHDTPAVFGGILSLAETAKASGEDLILAVALAHELSSRIQLAAKTAAVGAWELLPGKTTSRPGLQGFNSVTLAVAAAGGKVIGLNEEQMRNALGIASFTYPPNTILRYFNTSPVGMVKYTVFGQIAEAGVKSALLAQMGFTADSDSLDGEDSLWKTNQVWEPQIIADDLGKTWLHKMSYKAYPSNLGTAGAKDCLIDLLQENNIKAEEIEKITARVSPVWHHKSMRCNTLLTEEDFVYNVAYQLACAAHRINPCRWLDQCVRDDPRVMAFLDRVDFDIDCDQEAFSEARLNDPGAQLMSAEVVARGNVFKKQSLFYRGASSPKEFRLTDEDLIAKFRENVSLVLSPVAANKALAAVFDLEKMTNICDLTELFAPSHMGDKTKNHPGKTHRSYEP